MCPTYSNSDDTISISNIIGDTYFTMDADLALLPADQRDLIFDGNDQINLSRNFMTRIFTGSGGDSVFIEESDSIFIESDSGNDYISALNSVFVLSSGSGNDTVVSDQCFSFTYINTQSGDDTIFVSNSNSVRVFSGEGDDFIQITGYNVGLDLRSGAGRDCISIGSMQGGDVHSEEGDDYFHIYSREFSVSVSGGNGNDTYQVSGSANISDDFNSQSVDTLIIDRSDINVQAYGIERIITNNPDGVDFSGVSVTSNGIEYRGYTGNDTISGGTSDDLIWGLQGYDLLSGGAGSDTFAFSYLDGLSDTITDFSAAQGDRLGLTSSIFELPIGNLHPDRLVNIAGDPTNAASLGVAQLIYHINGAGNGNGNLYWDANGNVAGGLTWLGTINNTPLLTLSNFVVV